MSARIVNLDSAHREVRDLLPWFVTDALDADERRWVDEHLQACAACRGELEWERQLRAANNTALPARDADRAFAALRARLPARARETSWLERARALCERLLPQPWLGGVLALQAAVILGLGIALVAGRVPSATNAAPAYHALSRTTAADPVRLVVAFAPQTQVAELHRVLLASGARIVDGPTAADAYIVAVASDRLDTAVQQLRAEKSVLLVQSLDGRTPR